MRERGTTLDCSAHARNGQNGFSLIEMMVVITVMMIIAAMAIIQVQSSLPQNRANAAMAELKSALRQARETAVSDRRTVQVQFFTGAPCQATAACLVLTRLDPPANVPTVILTLPLQPTVNFMQFAGELDTPDGYGSSAPIVFGGVANGPPTMNFQSDGSFTDGTGNPINGTVFLGITNAPLSARGVTILGGTGRVHTYRWTGTGWIY